MKIVYLFLLNYLIFPTSFIFGQDVEWQKVKEKNDITIFRAKTSEKGIYKYKATFSLNAEIIVPISLLRDVNNYPDWISGVEKANILEQISETEWTYRFEVKVAMLKKYGIANAILNTDNQQQTIYYKMRPALLENYENDNKRLNQFGTDWCFKSTPEGTTLVEYIGLVDSQNAFIHFFIQSFIENALLRTIEKMKLEVKKNKNQQLDT